MSNKTLKLVMLVVMEVTLLSSTLAIITTVDGALHKFPCPENCHCNKQKFMVVCSNEKLTKIPKLSPLTKILNLDINNLDNLDFEWVVQQKLHHHDNSESDVELKLDIVELSVRRNNISSSSLSPNTFSKFLQLRYLHLDFNKIERLPADLFLHNLHLERLTLSNNPIIISDEAYISALLQTSLFTTLKFLDLSKTIFNSNASTLPSFVSNFASLEGFAFSSMSITNFTEEFLMPLTSLKHLRHVDVSDCSISHADGSAFRDSENLTDLDLTGANISLATFENILRGLNNSNIEVLNLERIFVNDVSNERLTHDSFRHLNLSQLKTLNMDGNFMAFRGRLPDKIFNSFQHLTKLYIEYCDISSLPLNSFQGLHALEKLSLKNNIIMCARGSNCQFFHGATMKRLKYFDFSNNRLSNTENSINFNEHTFSNLEVLDLKYNQLTSISTNMFQSLKKLHQLDLSHNPIEEIESDSFLHLSALTTLYIEECKHLFRLKQGVFNGLTSLRILNLRDSNIIHIHHSVFNHLNDLEELYLRNNKLGDSDGQTAKIFLTKSSLKILDLGMNNLEYIPGGLVHKTYDLHSFYFDGNRLDDCDELYKLQYLHNLETLDLGDNHLVDINSQCFSSLSSLKFLDVSGNPFYCSCSLPDFALWLITSGFVDENRNFHKCAGPSNYIGTSIFAFDPSSLECPAFREALLLVCLSLSFAVVLFLSFALCCVYQGRKLKLSAGSSSPKRAIKKNTTSRYSPLEEDESSRNVNAFDEITTDHQTFSDVENSYFNEDCNNEASNYVGRENEKSRKIYKNGVRNIFKKSSKTNPAKSSPATKLEKQKNRTPYGLQASEASRALTILPEGSQSSSSLPESELGIIDSSRLSFQITPVLNSLECDIHVQDSVL